jgi:carboxymethylenebutenolidase
VQARAVSFPAAGDRLRAYLALPDGPGPFPGVVVIHEAYGLNDNIREITQRFAGEGYAALAVDLFAGRSRAVCMARFMAGMLRGSLNPYGIAELKAALGYLSELSEVDAARVGAIGFCMGGGFAITWACTDDRLRAIAPFYGTSPRSTEALSRLCPVVGSYPEKDRITLGSARRLDEVLDHARVAHDIKIYPGARHSFFNESGRTYDPAAAEDAWRRVLAFFSEHVKAKGVTG